MITTLPISTRLPAPLYQDTISTGAAATLCSALPALSVDGRLREDGPYHLLCTLPGGGVLLLHPRFGVLAAHTGPTRDAVSVTSFGPSGTSVWDGVAERLGLRIGSERLPRFWLLEERPAHRDPLYACYDLQEWEAVGWTTDETEAIEEVRRANDLVWEAGGNAAQPLSAGIA